MVPKVGDTIFVPEIKKGKMPGKAFDNYDKRGGHAKVSRITQGSNGKHYIAVTNYGNIEFKWEGELEDKQETLKQEVGVNQAGFCP